MIRSLQTLRALGALMIFVHHFGFHNHVIEAFGDCAVDWFMMLSGFILTAVYDRRYAGTSDELTVTGNSVTQFVKKRFLRIAPMYYIGELIMLLICRFHINPKPLGAGLLMIQSWFNNEDIYYALNGATWFISDLMFCNVLFLPLLALRYNHPGWARTVPVLSMGSLITVSFLLPVEKAQYWLYIFPVAQLVPFIIGMFLWKIADRIRGLAWHPRVADISIILSCAVIVIALITARDVPTNFTKNVYWWIPSALILVILTACDKTKSIVIRFFHWKPLIDLGNASLTFYILHLPWILFTHYITDIFNPEMNQVLPAIVSAFGLWLLSILIHNRFFPRRI